MAFPSKLTRPLSGGLSRSFYEAKLRRRSSARRCTLCLLLFIGSLAVIYEALWTYWLAGVNIPNVERDPVTGKDRVRRRPDLSVKYDPEQHDRVHTEPFDAIMEGFFTLVDIEIPPEGLVSNGDQAYTEVIATFCQISWTFQQDNPKNVPLFRNLKERSFLCPETAVTADLHAIARQAEQYDAGTNKFAATKKPKGFQIVPPTGVIFHESHSGSTLASSIFAASDPQHIHVYSEAPATETALLACDNNVHCDEGAQEKLIQDVFYLMGRMNRPSKKQSVFFKMSAVSVRSIDVFRKAFPKVPWVFLFRNSIEVLVGQLHDYTDSSLLLPDLYVPNCLKERHNQWQHPHLVKVLERHNRTVTSLTAEEYCAAHIASLAQSALTENDLSSSLWASHMFVNYDDLPLILWDRIIPELNYMSQPLSLRIDAMHDTSKYYFSATSNPRMGQMWQEDKATKQGEATDAMKNAAQLFLDPLYAQMDTIRVRPAM